jgi:hypothetical protein
MASIKFQLETENFELAQIKNLIKIFPDARRELLNHIGYRSKKILKQSLLSGQELDFHGEKDKKGRRKIQYSIGRRASRVSISAYPANFWEHGMTRRGTKYAGRKIITGKLKNLVNAQLQGMINEFDSGKMQSIMDKL